MIVSFVCQEQYSWRSRVSYLETNLDTDIFISQEISSHVLITT